MNLLAEQEIPIDIIDANSDLNWTFSTDILAPDPAQDFDADDYNNRSVVIMAQFGEIELLLTGDAEAECNSFLQENYEVSAEILKVSHHGAGNGSSAEFIQAVSPKISVICSGNNGYGHPSPDVISWLEQAGSQIFSTADDYNSWTGNGSDDSSVDDDVILETDGSSIWVNDELVLNGNFDLPLRQGWNLISVPQILESDLPAIFPNASVIWGYEPDEGWEVPTEMQLGKGYWVKNAVAETISVSNSTIDEINIELQLGWNLIGIPFNAIVPNDIALQVIWGYGASGWQSYQSDDVLPMGYGYWMKASQDFVFGMEQP